MNPPQRRRLFTGALATIGLGVAADRSGGAQQGQSAPAGGFLPRYCCYRLRGDNPVTFTGHLKHTMEHGHGNSRGDDFCSCSFWYQARPHTGFPPLSAAADGIPRVTVTGARTGIQTVSGTRLGPAAGRRPSSFRIRHRISSTIAPGG